MKNKFILSLILILTAIAPARSTLVEFPIQSMFPAYAWTKTFMITARYPLLVSGTNIYSGNLLRVTPTGGTNPIVALRPNEYLVSFPEARATMRIYVPDTNVVLNAINLTTNLGTYIYTNVNLAGGSTAGFSGTVTNLAVAGSKTTNTSLLIIPSPAPDIYSGYIYYPAQFAGYTNAFTNSTLGVGLALVDNSAVEWHMFHDTGSGFDLLFFSTQGMANPFPPLGTWTSFDDYSAKTFTIEWVYTTTNTSRYNYLFFTNGVCVTNIFQ